MGTTRRFGISVAVVVPSGQVARANPSSPGERIPVSSGRSLPGKALRMTAGLASKLLHMMGLLAVAGTAPPVGADGDTDADEEACKPLRPSSNEDLRDGGVGSSDTLSDTTGLGFAGDGVCPSLLAWMYVHECKRHAIATQTCCECACMRSLCACDAHCTSCVCAYACIRCLPLLVCTHIGTRYRCKKQVCMQGAGGRTVVLIAG